MKASAEIPPLDELKAFKPAHSTTYEDTLTYPVLNERAQKHSRFDSARQSRFYKEKAGTLQEEWAARSLARQYFVMTAQRLNSTQSDEYKQIWSERFTQASVEMYGQPDAKLATEIGSSSASKLINDAEAAEVDIELIRRFRDTAETYGFNLSDNYEIEAYRDISDAIGQHIAVEYDSVFNLLGFTEMSVAISPELFADRVEAVIPLLADEHDEQWRNWMVDRVKNRTNLSVDGNMKRLIVGLDRPAMSPEKARGLFAHEMLTHGLRAINGSKISPDFGKGLPNYTASEEGMGILSDYAVTGNFPITIADRYVDIALALGLIDGTQKTRREITDFSIMRLALRNALMQACERKSPEEISFTATKQTNRLYRGSLGNEFIGVMTKDIAYQKGFIEMAEFFKERLEKGLSVKEVYDYVMQGKFDPLKERHVAELERVKNEQ